MHHPYYTFIYHIFVLNRETPDLPTVKEETSEKQILKYSLAKPQKV